MTKHNSNGAVYNITDAQEAHTDEMRTRIIKYSVSMGIRMVCLILIFFVSGWMQWVLMAGAVFLPWFAVLIANAGGAQTTMEHSEALLDAAPVAELTSAPEVSERPEDSVVQGEIVDENKEDPRK